MEYLEEELEDWLAEELEPYGDDDYLLFDCPGQIELYSHSSVFRALVRYLQSNGWQVRPSLDILLHLLVIRTHCMRGRRKLGYGMMLL